MQLNKEIFEILRSHKIDKSQGILCLLGIYFNLDIATTCSEETISSINLTKIVEKEYISDTIKWNISLFQGQETAFEWVSDWIEPFGRINPDRKGSTRDAVPRMKDFFAKYPEYRKSDVYAARDLYLGSIKDSKFLMKSHKFIFDGAGVMKKSTLLEYCEKVTTTSTISNMRGKIIS